MAERGDPIAGAESLPGVLRLVGYILIGAAVLGGFGIASDAESPALGFAIGFSAGASGLLFFFCARVIELLKIIVERLGRLPPPPTPGRTDSDLIGG